MKKITETKYLGDSELVFTCINEGAGLLDTKVEINGALLCWITFSELESFYYDLLVTLEKYKI